MEGILVGKDENGNIIIEMPDGMKIPVPPQQLIPVSAGSSEAMSRIKTKVKSEPVASKGKKAQSDTATSKKSGSRKKADGNVIDLHIESVVKNYSRLRPEEYLDRQIMYFHRAAARLVSAGARELIVIHGEGSGVLKSSIVEAVRKKWPGSEVMDAPYHRFRFGATRIIIKGI
ncbi:MAG: hypothetical protein IH591_17280 [Bacteroidales bacterium]|nr:hypothetical protein [Bacteroidales bacterium]